MQTFRRISQLRSEHDFVDSPAGSTGATSRFRTAGDHIRYPDGFVTCTGGENASTIVSDPVVIFEVLSPSTAATDRITKAREYQAMPSVQRYVMVEQDRIGATVYTRASSDWKHQILIEDSVLVLPEIGVELPLTELYEGLAFDRDESADQSPTSEPA